MRVLVACEFSGIVRDAFANRGHEAHSCDLLPSEIAPKWPNAWHFHGDVRDAIDPMNRFLTAVALSPIVGFGVVLLLYACGGIQ